MELKVKTEETYPLPAAVHVAKSKVVCFQNVELLAHILQNELAFVLRLKHKGYRETLMNISIFTYILDFE